MEKRAIQMDPHDNVATVLFDVQIGDMGWVYDQNQVLVERVVAQSPILSGNKLALSDMPEKSTMIKYGENVGVVIKPIAKGHLVHVHNVRSMHLDIPDSIIRDIISVMNITE